MKITIRRMSKKVTRTFFDEEEIGDHFDIVFGEGQETISIMERDGHMEVSAADGQLIVRPRASNVVWIDCQRFFPNVSATESDLSRPTQGVPRTQTPMPEELK